MRLWHIRWTRLVPLLALLATLTYFILDTYFVTCILRTCTSNHSVLQGQSDGNLVVNKNALSDLNGIEICLSIKFVDPIQKIELDGSPQLGKDGPYSVVYNYLKSSRFYSENETVTYTTHSTPEYMEHIGNVADGWEGPVSVAMFVPFTDFCRTVHKMIYLRNCDKAAYREKVTWHIFWPNDSPPTSNWNLVPDETHVDCSKLATDYKHNEDLRVTWRSVQKLSYPVNVGRNVARHASTTWFVLPSDVELYPSVGLASQFIDFIHRSARETVKPAISSMTVAPGFDSSTPIPKVYVVPVFEVQKSIPGIKEELMIQYARRSAIYFHKLVCRHCQNFPGLKQWIIKPGTPGEIHVQSWSYRHPPYQRWEPIYICSRHEPLYEERLSWEGLQDKMTQMHELCVRNYQFHLLDRAFLVHSVGIKRLKKKNKHSAANTDMWRQPFVEKNSEIYNQVIVDLEQRYGAKGECHHHL